jgi:integrase
LGQTRTRSDRSLARLRPGCNGVQPPGAFRKVTGAAGLNPADWTPRELRHSFVSLLSDAGVPIEQISRLVGHSGTTTTEAIYRKQIRPVITNGAEVMDRLFPWDSPAAGQAPPDA